MANFAATNTFVSGASITAAGHNTNWSDITTYINNRNASTTAWDGFSLAVNTKLYLDGTTHNNYLIQATTNVIDIYTTGIQRFSVASDGVRAKNADLVISSLKKFYLDDGGDTYFIESAANIIDIYAGATLALSILPTDLYTVAYQDYSATSTIVGWTSFTTKLIYYKVIGKLVWVWYGLIGTSNATTVSFTLPYTSANTLGSRAACTVTDNGVVATTPGVSILNANSATVNVGKDYVSTLTAWTSSGSKSVVGQFFYQAI